VLWVNKLAPGSPPSGANSFSGKGNAWSKL
jgi:hypothetical protein